MHEEWQGSIVKNTRVNRNTFIVAHIYPPHIIKNKKTTIRSAGLLFIIFKVS
uniref:Uncharacterized protein n=1 Tax=Escherichia coli TaxID=562 RepID=A0A075MCW5_ECOLX|nr:hypothetical protein [Escherichia coli]